ncbi:MAG: DUF2235 domain-containing protein, partial [Clostridiales bacterium]|nr:DUF2235 domain-containing protein [Clostridiales bacterium]
DDATSYYQEYTNIPIMHDLEPLLKNSKIITVYIEGVGSVKYGKDDVLKGAGLGSNKNKTGIPSKIQRAMDEIIEKTNDLIDSQTETCGKVKVSVFGFSRGSAVARNFVSKKGELAQLLKIAQRNITYTFVGIFDTVSAVFLENDSYNHISIKGDNVAEFQLAMGAHVQKAVQLTAADEYREKFALTNIKSSIDAGVGFEMEVPGSHCDVGGGFLDNEKEHIDETLYYPQQSEFIHKFIEQ